MIEIVMPKRRNYDVSLISQNLFTDAPKVPYPKFLRYKESKYS